MTRNYLVVGSGGRTREALAVLLRSRGHTVTVVPSAADAVQALRGPTFDAVLIVDDTGGGEGRRLHGRLLREQGIGRVLLVDSSVSGAAANRVHRFGIGDHRLSEAELVALVEADDLARTVEADGQTVDAGVRALLDVVNVLVGLRELNDAHHRGSTYRATVLTRSVAERMKLPPIEIVEILVATLLRDVGMIEIDDLCETSGAFSTTQRTRMQDHVAAGVRLLEHIEFPWAVLPIIRHHHEHYDGTGYPGGLRGPEIPLGARIVAAVDAYVAMMSERPHRPSHSIAEARAELLRLAGKQFDPEVVEILLNVVMEGAVSLDSHERPRVLVADSALEFVKLLKFRLVNEAFEVDTVTSPEEAVLKMLDTPPSIVLAGVGSDADMTMHLLSEIREDRELRLTPVLILADAADRTFKLRALRQGADDYLLKSIGLEEIVARVHAILAREALRKSDVDGPRQRGITGQLESLSLPDIFQTINLGLKTARVSLERQGVDATIWFDSGAAVHAGVGGKVGEAACFDLLAWKDGTFCIEHGLETDERSIEMDTMFMVMEGLRQLDEAAHQPQAEPVG